MAEVEINGNAYQIGRMDARRQFHVVRRLTPVMAALAANVKGGTDDNTILGALVPMGSALAEMKDEDADYVINACLAVCQRQNTVHGTGWGAVMASNGRLMFEDIQMPEMMQLVAKTIQENLASFFPALGQLST